MASVSQLSWALGCEAFGKRCGFEANGGEVATQRPPNPKTVRSQRFTSYTRNGHAEVQASEAPMGDSASAAVGGGASAHEEIA